MWIDSFRVGLSDTLEDAIKVGDRVVVDILNNKTDTGFLIPGARTPWVASAVHKGKRAVLDEPHPEAAGIGSVAHKVRIFELYAKEDGAIVSGLATIQQSPIIKTGGAAASMIGEYCTFKVIF